MLPREIGELCHEIKQAGFHVTIETAGTIHRELPCDLMSISPKFANSDPDEERAGEWRAKHQLARYRPGVVKRLMSEYAYQLKFVVDQPDDLDEIVTYLAELKPVDRTRVLLMPQGVEQDELQQRKRWLVPICEEHGFTFCPRSHIEWYGNKRGT